MRLNIIDQGLSRGTARDKTTRAGTNREWTRRAIQWSVDLDSFGDLVFPHGRARSCCVERLWTSDLGEYKVYSRLSARAIQALSFDTGRVTPTMTEFWQPRENV